MTACATFVDQTGGHPFFWVTKTVFCQQLLTGLEYWGETNIKLWHLMGAAN